VKRAVAVLSILAPLLGCAVRAPAGFESRIRATGSAAEVDDFVSAFPETPVIEGNRAYLYWRGEAKRVQWIGDHNGWVRETAPDLTRVPGTDVWWGSMEFPATARIDYKLLVDGESWILDPRCPGTCAGGYGPNSELRMPGYRPPPELIPSPQERASPLGRVERFTFPSTVLGEDRSYWVYLPPGAEGATGLPSVWFHDGDGYLEYADAAGTLDRLIALGEIPPTFGIFVPPVERGEELGATGEGYLRFVAEELLPAIRDRYPVSGDPARTVTIGISLGGAAAVRFALARPDLFGLAAGHSGAYGGAGDPIVRDVREGPLRPVRFHLVVGTYETALGGDPVHGNLLESQRLLARALAERGYGHRAHEYPEGHSWGLWRANLGDALRFLLAKPGSATE
jgi:enterochelin esterase family protein